MAFSLAHDVRIGDSLVRIRCAGTGRPLLLLHDIGGCGASFAGLTSAVVAMGREAVAPDLPGFAFSDPIDGGLPELVAYLQELTERTIDDPVDVVGYGFGGYLALSLAAQRPDRYRRLVLQDPMTPPPPGGGAASRMTASVVLRGASTALRRGRRLRNVGGFGRAKNLLETLAQTDRDWWNGLAAIRAEVLLLDLGAARPDNRTRLRQLEKALPTVEYRDLSRGKTPDGPGVAAQRALLDFMS